MVVGLTAASISGAAQADPADPSSGLLAGLARDLLLVENAELLADADRERLTAGLRLALTAAGQEKAAARQEISRDAQAAREAAGAQVRRRGTG